MLTVKALKRFLQVNPGGKVESRMVFRFKDSSVFDEMVVFSQQGVQNYASCHKAPANPKR